MTAHVVQVTIDLEALAATAGAATRGPWRWEQFRYGPPNLVGRAGEIGIYEYDREVIEASHTGGCGCRAECTLTLEISPEDRAYLETVSPDVVIALIDRVTTAEAALEQASRS